MREIFIFAWERKEIFNDYYLVRLYSCISKCIYRDTLDRNIHPTTLLLPLIYERPMQPLTAFSSYTGIHSNSLFTVESNILISHELTKLVIYLHS